MIGKNVTIGNNVYIGGKLATPTAPTTPPPASNSSTLPADYDAKHFDPVAYLPRAEAFARSLLPDAQLTSFEFDPVFPDGHVDLTMDGQDREYEFRSPSRSQHPADVPRNVPVDLPCRVHIEVGAREVTARIVKSDSCDKKLIRHPRCQFSAVWQQALATGTPRDVVARIAWLSDEQWFFDIDLANKGTGGVQTIPDRCP